MSKVPLMMLAVIASTLLLPGGTAWSEEKDYFAFRDVLAEQGLDPVINDLEFRTHAAAWGDMTGSGRLDLYVGTMSGKLPGVFFRNNGGRFTLVKDHSAAVVARATAAVFVDLDNNGRLELYVSNHGGKTDNSPHGVPNLLIRYKTDGTFESVKDSGATPNIVSRGIGAMDYDGDGLVDLFVTTRPAGGQRSWLFHNLGGLKFKEGSEQAHLPADIHGLGVAVADLTGNGYPDFIVGGSNRVFLNRGDGTFREAIELRPLLDWHYQAEDMADSCGVAWADINRDGRPDLVIGFHTSWPWSKDPRPVRLFLNMGCTPEHAAFKEITAEAGLGKLWMKAPCVQLLDFDNDGWPDLMTSVVVYDAEGKCHPLIYKNMGATPGGVPKFRETTLRYQPNFPTERDKTVNKKVFYDTVPADLRVFYYPLGPAGDFDNDGRLDIFFSRGDPKTPSLLLKNETPGGHWLDVKMEGSGRVSRQGIGTVVRAYRTGYLGDPASLIYTQEIAVGYGYSSGQPAIAHLGLGDSADCDLEVVFPHGRGTVRRKAVKANQVLRILETSSGQGITAKPG